MEIKLIQKSTGFFFQFTYLIQNEVSKQNILSVQGELIFNYKFNVANLKYVVLGI